MMGSTKREMIDCYIKTLATVLGRCNILMVLLIVVGCLSYCCSEGGRFIMCHGFGWEVDEETAIKLGGKPGVLFVRPDSYVDAENKDYSAELFVNGEIVKRSPERQGRVEPQHQRFNDRTSYTRVRQHMG